jgi:diacylglycerol O-acyltransferase / wax synthase
MLMMAQFLRNTDAFVWSIEKDPGLRSTIVTLVLLDRSPDWSEVFNRFELLSRRVPTFRQRVMSSMPPAPPRWEADPDFDLAFHVRRVDAPGPATIDTLLEMARVAAMADFDRARPLWEVTLIDGFANGGAALLCKLHHSLTDGIGAVGIAMSLYDMAPDYEHRALPPIPATSVAGHLAGFLDSIGYGADLVASAIADSMKAGPGNLASSILHPLSAAAGFGARAASVVRTARPIRRPGSPIMVKRNHHRRLAVHEVPTQRLRQAGKACGGSVNDAFIAAVAGGLAKYHEKHDVAVGHLSVTMPVSIRTDADPLGGNRATLMRFNLSAVDNDAAHLIRKVHEQTDRSRNEKSLAYTQLIAGVLNLAPRWYVGSTLKHVDFVASNVPGFPTPVYLAGASVRKQYSFSPTIGAAVNVTLLSYVDTCALGINVDTGAIPDFDVFYDCFVAGFDDVLALAD